MTLEVLRQVLIDDVVEAAQALVGATLVDGGLRAQIVETEAYRHDDPACHAFGKTQMKNMALYGEPGTAYIYLAYGNHWMLNVVAHAYGMPAAVLIRAARPLSGLEQMRTRRSVPDQQLLSGPGKLAQALGIGPELNGQQLLKQEGLHIEPRVRDDLSIIAAARVGIREGKWHDVPWRFVDANQMDWVSNPKP